MADKPGNVQEMSRAGLPEAGYLQAGKKPFWMENFKDRQPIINVMVKEILKSNYLQ